MWSGEENTDDDGLERVDTNESAETWLMTGKSAERRADASARGQSATVDLSRPLLPSEMERYVSILVPTRYREESLKACLEAIGDNTGECCNYEVIVFRDEASPPLGLPRATNAASKQARGEYLACLGDNAVPLKNWLSEAMGLMFGAFPEGCGCIGFNALMGEGVFKHFVIHRSLVETVLDGQLLHEGYGHQWAHSELHSRLLALDRYRWSEKAVVLHSSWSEADRSSGACGRKKDDYDVWAEAVQGRDTVLFYKRRHQWCPNRRLWELKLSQVNRGATVIIVTFQSRESIAPCLRSVSRWLRPIDEVIVVDNHSQDDTLLLLRRICCENPSIRLIENRDNRGFSRACNQGAKVARNPFLVFLNPDTVVTDGWIEKLLSRLEGNVKAVGPISNYAAGHQYSEHFNRFPVTGPVEVDVAGRMYEEWWFGKQLKVKLLTGFCLATERATFESLGRFDERFFVGNEDLDFCWQLTLRGLEIVVAPDVFVYHAGHQSFSPQAENLTAESTEALFGKLEAHYGPGEVPHPADIWGVDLIGPGKFPFKEATRLP